MLQSYDIRFQECYGNLPVTDLLHDMIHGEMEVYVDDMTAKSKGEEDYLVNLGKVFNRLKKYQLKLNRSKYVFRATSDKLLGFFVSRKGPTVWKVLTSMMSISF